MNSDVLTLQSIANTLEKEPLASQRVLAKNAGISIGLMNAILKRFVERGWIMLSNVNLKKLSYAVTPAGIAELSSRSQKFAKRTFELANSYNETICDFVSKAKTQGKTSVALYGDSYIKFLVSYACHHYSIDFVEKAVTDEIDETALCLVGELCDEETVARLENKGCQNLLSLIAK